MVASARADCLSRGFVVWDFRPDRRLLSGDEGGCVVGELYVAEGEFAGDIRTA